MIPVPARWALTLVVCLVAFSGQGGCKAGPWTLWESYSQSFIDGQGRVIDHQGGDRTTSEGQAYAMFFALAANDRVQFDRLLKWTVDNLAQGDLTARLPGWKWGKAEDGQWRLLDPNSAADADLWMSYTLLEAGRLWQEPRYSRLGSLLAARIAREEVVELPGFGVMLAPGKTGFQQGGNVWVLNPSYLPLPLLVRLSRIQPHGPWARVADATPRMLEMSARKGFAMDWVSYSTQAGFAPATAPGGAAGTHFGSYDAIRVYLWAGMSAPEIRGRDTVLNALPGMKVWLDSHPLPPERVDDQGNIANPTGPAGFSAALLPYLDAVGQNQALEQQRARLKGEQDKQTHLYGAQRSYYDQNLALFGTGWMDRRFRFGSGGELNVIWKR